MFPPASSRDLARPLLRGALCGVLLSLPIAAQNLYVTDFESFTPGPDQWVGTEGWLGNGTGVGAHGIDEDLLPTLGKTAYLGFNQPASTFTFTAQPFNYDPGAQGKASIYVDTLLGIEDSTNSRYDNKRRIRGTEGAVVYDKAG